MEITKEFYPGQTFEAVTDSDIYYLVLIQLGNKLYALIDLENGQAIAIDKNIYCAKSVHKLYDLIKPKFNSLKPIKLKGVITSD